MKTVLSILSLISIFFYVGCNNEEAINYATVNGSWTSYYVSDKNLKPVKNAPKYTLIIKQNQNLLEAVLKIKDNLSIVSIELNGTVINNAFSLDGQYSDDDYNIEGIWENNDSMQVSVIQNFGSDDPSRTSIRHLLLSRTIDKNPITNTNKYALNNVCGKDNDKNIILVHGFNSDAGIWKSMVDHFRENSVCDEYSVWTYQYDWKKHIATSAADMISRVNAYIPSNEEPILIAHSMGGLVARSYIMQHGYFERLITMGTPHKGASKLSEIIPNIACEGLSDMKPGSDFITKLNSDSFEQSQRSKYLLLNGRIDHHWVWEKVCKQICIHYYWDWHWHKSCKTKCCDHCKGHFEWTGNYPKTIKLGFLQFVTHDGVKIITRPNDGIVAQSSARFEGDNSVQRADADKFKWICHDWLPYKSAVMEYVTDQLMDL